MDFRKNGRGHRRVWNIIFCPNISCCLKTGNILLVFEQKHAPKRLSFQHFVVMGNLKWSERGCFNSQDVSYPMRLDTCTRLIRDISSKNLYPVGSVSDLSPAQQLNKALS